MPTEPAPLVSAVIPAYNAEPFVREAIESVLGQTHPRVECVVVDDGSTDATADVALGFGDRVRTLRQRNRGVSAARNAGAREARGSLLAFLDADDRWSPDLVVRALDTLATTGADAAVSVGQLIAVDGTPVGSWQPVAEPTLELMLRFGGRLPAVASSLLIRREAYDAIGPFDERLRMSADWELLARILASPFRLAVMNEPLVDLRVHDRNMSKDLGLLEGDIVRAFEITFSREGDRLERLRRPAYGSLHRMLSGSFAHNGRPGRAVVHAIRGVRRDPLSLARIVRSAVRWRRHGRERSGPRSVRFASGAGPIDQP